MCIKLILIRTLAIVIIIGKHSVNKIVKLVIVFVVLVIKTTTAQQYNFKNYSVENGLPYIQIFALYQDSKGYLWSGGYGGLSKFNGKTFKNYSPKNGLANHYVNAITEDKKNRIIVGTINGLSVIDDDKTTNYNTKNGLCSKNITALCTDNNNVVWIGTTKGLCKLLNNKISVVNDYKNLQINCFINTPNGLCVGTNNGFYYNNKNYNELQSLTNNTVLSLAYNALSNSLIIGTQNGLSIFSFDTKKITNYHVSNGLLDEAVTTVAVSPKGELFIGSKNGLLSINQNQFYYYTIKKDNNSNNVRALLFDYEGNLWIGSHNGLFRYRDKGFASYGNEDGLGSALIYEINADFKKNIWITTENNGVFKYENGYFKNYSTKNGMHSNQVHCVLPLLNGTIWFGTTNGISVLNNDGSFKNINFGGHNLQQSVNSLLLDADGNIWAGGKNEVCKFIKQHNTYTQQYYTIATTIKDVDVWSLKQDKNKTIWAGTYLAGLYKLEGGKFINQAANIKTEFESALDIDFDTDGLLYAATLNGVLVYNPKTHTSKLISEKDGLSSELVYSLKLTNDKKHIWAGTNQGINKIDVLKLKQNYIDIKQYNKTDGFEGVECNSHGIFEDEQNAIWFGTVNGIVKYAANEFITNVDFAKTTISTIKISYQDTVLKNGTTLPYHLNNISFYFDGICLTNPDKVLYTYKLDGFDKNWSPNTDVNFSKYDNLPAGKYTFKVKSCNNEGIWNIEPVTFSFTIRQAFYKTWLFIFGSLVVISLIVFGIFKYRLSQLQLKQKNEFDKKVEISKAELKALRAQMNPHFVFNSLNSIQHYILNNKGDEAVKYLSKFAKLIRNILNNSEKPTVTINEDLEAIVLYLELEKMRFDNKFTYTIHIDDNIDADYDEIPPMIIQPYLENAILHGINPKDDLGHIDIHIKLIINYIKICITDDGIGREKSKALVSVLSKQKHKSFGMKITEDRVKILNSLQQSHLSVNIIDLYDNTKQAIGTKVEVYIPYQK